MSDEMKVQTKGFNKKFLFAAIALVAVGLVVALVLWIPTTAKAKKVEEQLNLGARYLSELDYEQAIVAYEAVIKIDPKCEEAYLALADVYIAMGEFDKAEGVLKRAEEEIGSDITGAVSSKRKEIENVKEKQNQVEVPTSTPTSSLEPTSTPTPTVTPSPVAHTIYDGTIVELSEAKVGDVVLFGTYEQDNIASNGAETIPWYVLDKDGDKLLLMSVYLIDAVPYHEEYTSITWEDCTLRQWMNDDFYNSAFTESEKKHILTSYLENDADKPYFSTEGGNDTEDKVFALSWAEAEQYFGIAKDGGSYWVSASPKLSAAKETAYANVQGASVVWWLRSPGYHNNHVAASVAYNGDVYNGHIVVNSELAVRPALWLNLKGDLSEGDIFDLTDGKDDDEDVRILHSLKADPENLLTFDEITFLGHSIVNLDIDTAQRLLEENNYSVTTNLEWDDPDETDYLWISGRRNLYTYSDVSAIQYFIDNYISSWNITQYSFYNETTTPVGTRNINMHDTFGEVFEKIGFDNAYEVEADIEYCFEQVFLNDGEMSEKDRGILESMMKYGNWNDRVSMWNGGIGWRNEEQEGMQYYSIEVSLSDTLFQEPNMDKNYWLHLKFERDENTNGKLILTDYRMSVYKEP